MIYIHKKDYSDPKTLTLPKKVRAHQLSPIISYNDLEQILVNSSVVFTENTDKDISYITHKNKESDDSTSIGNVLNVDTNVKLIDLDRNETLTTIDKVIEFIRETLKLSSFIVTPSASQFIKGKKYKWHVWCVFDKPLSQKQFGRYIKGRLPNDSFIEELRTNSLGIQYKFKYNNLIDLVPYTSNGRKIAEYPYKKVIHKYNTEMLNKWSKVVQAKEIIMSKKTHNKTYTPDQITKNFHDSDHFLPTDFVQNTKGEFIQIKDLTKSQRLVSPIDVGIKLSGDMQYYHDTKTFVDFNQGGKKYRIAYSKSETIEYTSDFLPKLDLSHDNTFILAPTGSGKTHAIKKQLSSKTIVIVPRKSIVKDQGGLQSGFARWNDVSESEVNFMTFNKLSGHLHFDKDISEYNIVIDEIHTLFSAHDNLLYQRIYEELLLRKTKFKKLILLSATMDADLLPVKNLKSYKYINTSKKTQIDFIKNVPEIDNLINGKTLIFKQSKMSNASIYDRYSKTHKILNLKSGSEIPKDLSEYDIIITTSVLREGFSITSHIDTVLLYNVRNSFGAYDIIQSIARPRINQPDIKIISASTHFTEEDVQIPSLASLKDAAYDLSKGYEISDLHVIKAINLDKFKKMSLTIKTIDDLEEVVINDLGLISYYLELKASLELKDFELMTKNLKKYLNCNTSLEILSDESSQLPQITIKELKERFKSCTTFEELDRIVKILESIEDYAAQASELLSTLKDTVTTIETSEGLKYLTEEQQVQYKVNPAVYSKINQHKKNINNGVYDTLNSNRTWKYNDTFEVRGLKRIFKILDKQKKKFTDEEVFDVLRKVCRFEKIKKDGTIVKRGDFDYIKVTHKTLIDIEKTPKEIEISNI